MIIYIIYYFIVGGTIFLEIYLDNAATTKPYLDSAIKHHADDGWYNPSAAYKPAEAVFSEIKNIRQTLTESLGLPGGTCVFTSGGTEANNMAVLSSWRKGAHYITSTIEHPSVYVMFKHLEQQGAEVDFVTPKGFHIEPQDVASLVRENTALVSIMHVNNETGALHDIKEICRAVKAKNPDTLFHSDGVQALLKTSVSLSDLGVDYYTVSAHKIHGLKGTGALLARQGCTIKPVLLGGSQENVLRAGTENTLGIQVFGDALRRGLADTATFAHVEALRAALLSGLRQIEGAVLNIPDAYVPHIVSVSFEGVRAEVLTRMLGDQGICIGTGAACSRGKVSRVLLESGIKRSLAEGTVRISMSDNNSADDIQICLEALEKAVRQLRRFSHRG
jgi:cysteine desulfurase